MKGTSVFLKIDLRSSYCQIRVVKQNIPKTALTKRILSWKLTIMYYHISLTELKTKNIVSHLRGRIGSEVEIYDIPVCGQPNLNLHKVWFHNGIKTTISG